MHNLQLHRRRRGVPTNKKDMFSGVKKCCLLKKKMAIRRLIEVYPLVQQKEHYLSGSRTSPCCSFTFEKSSYFFPSFCSFIIFCYFEITMNICAVYSRACEIFSMYDLFFFFFLAFFSLFFNLL